MAGWLVDPLTGRSAECATGCDHRMTGLPSRRRATCTFTPKDQVCAAGGGELHTRKQGNEESVREFHVAADVPGGTHGQDIKKGKAAVVKRIMMGLVGCGRCLRRCHPCHHFPQMRPQRGLDTASLHAHSRRSYRAAGEADGSDTEIGTTGES